MGSPGYPAGRRQGEHLPAHARRAAIRWLRRLVLAPAALAAPGATPPAPARGGAGGHCRRYPAGPRARTGTRRGVGRAGARATGVHANRLPRAPHAADRDPWLRVAARGGIARRDATGGTARAP